MFNSTHKPLLHIYSASAGSGKTYTLTQQFLKLALLNPVEKPFRILAITFTNKATTEMRSRIINALIQLSKNQDSPYVDYLTKELQISEEELRLRAQIALTEILHNYHKFGISTIDKFFQKILRSFAREIKRVGFETEIIQDDAIDFMVQGLLDDLTQNYNLKNWILSFAKERIQDKATSWNFKGELQAHASKLFSEKFKELSLKFPEPIPLEAFMELKDGLKNLIVSIEAEFNKIILEARKNFVDFDIENFPQKSRNIITSKLLKEQEFHISTLYFKKLEEDTQNFIDKYGHNFKGDNEFYMQKFQTEFIDKALKFCEKHSTNYNTAVTILSNLYTLAISTDLLKHLENYRNEHNILLLSDSTDFIALMTQDSDTPFIYEKIGNKYEHYLLDEFQDTSSLQWNNLAPLLRNSLEQGFENLIVGDAKQAIYRFRNGDKSLLQYKVKEQFGDYAETLYLDTNYRSLKNIILFNNTISLIAAKTLSAEIHADKEASDWMKTEIDRSVELFQNSAQKFTSKEGGYVELDFHVTTHGEEVEDDALTPEEINFQKAIDYIQDALLRGYRQSDICILSRKKDQLQKFAHFIAIRNESGEHPKIETVSSETGLLTRSAAVRCIIACFKYVNNPKDLISLIEVITAWYELRGIPFQAHILQEKNAEQLLLELLPADFNIKEILHKSLLDAYHYLIHCLQLNIYPNHAGYLHGLEDRIIQFIQKYKTGLSDFINVWNENADKYMLSASDDTNGVKLMTIHKSKGLEFPVVIYLAKDTNVVSSHREKIWVSTDEGMSSKMGILHVPANKNLIETEFRSAYEEEYIENINDGLNAFYVAITRAERELYMLSEIKLTKEMTVSSKNAVDKFLYQTLFLDKVNHYPTSEFFINPANYIDGDKLIMGEKTYFTPKEKTKSNVQLSNFYQSNPHRNIKIKPARVLTEKKEIRIGMLAHELLALVKNQKDIDNFIEEWYINGEIISEEKEDLKNLLGQLFGNILVASWFNTEAEVLTETPLISQNGAIKIPDRILIHKDHNEIIDFKTGKPMAEHETQISEYAQLISELTGNPSKAYILYLSDFSIQEVNHGK